MPRWLATACLLAACTKQAAPELSTPMQVKGDACGARFDHLNGSVHVTNGPTRLCELRVRFRMNSTEMAFHHWSRELDLAADGGLPALTTLDVQPSAYPKAETIGNAEVLGCTPCP